jgi:Holliday junction resolvase RusA-like endonuclease
MFTLFVSGEPRPQGSKKAFSRGAHIVLVEANKQLPAWRETMKKAFQMKMLELDSPFVTAVSVSLTFWLTRPKSVKREYATGTYDLDKLTRACLDSLESAGVLSNDNLVVDLSARKNYADNHESGVLVTVTPFDNEMITAGVSNLDRKRKGYV